MRRRDALAALLGSAAAMALAAPASAYEVTRTDEEWKKILPPLAYKVLRQEWTEPPGSSPLDEEHRPGYYFCAGCALLLFTSDTKFDSGTGWPSFFRPEPNAVETKHDFSFMMDRTAVLCRRCGGHLGHVFGDGPRPTGLRYCMNGAALTFKPATAKQVAG